MREVEKQTTNGERILSVAQVAAELGVTAFTVRSLIRAGEIEAMRVGKPFKVRRADLDAYKQHARALAKAA